METVESVLAALRKDGKESAAKTYRRHGVTDETWGVSYAALETIQKKIGSNSALAEGLWNSGIHDARVLATRLVDPSKLTRKQAESWTVELRNYVLADTLARMVSKATEGLAWAQAWIDSKAEFTAAAGWSVLAIKALDGQLDEATAAALLARIQHELKSAPNRVRHCMNNALIAIGGSIPSMTEPAIKVARAIGKVVVDHGDTDCKTPDAVPYIEKMLARRSAKTATKKAVSKKPASSSRKPVAKKK